MLYILIQQGAAFNDKFRRDPDDSHSHKKNEKPNRPDTAGI